MDLLPPSEQPDKPIQTQQATAALPSLSKESILSRASFTSSANFDDPPRNIDGGRRHTSFAHVLKSSLVELAKLDGDFNNVWIKEFRELYFNPLPLQRFCYVMCLGSAAMSVNNYFYEIVEKGYHERAGIPEHPEEYFWELMSTICYAFPVATGVISLILLSIRCLRRFAIQNYSGIVFFSLFCPFISFCILESTSLRHWGVSTYRWDTNGFEPHAIMQNITYNISFSNNHLPTVSCRDTNAAARLLEVNAYSMSRNGCEPSFIAPSNLLLFFSLSMFGSSLHCGPKYFAGFIIASFISCYLIQIGSVGNPTFTDRCTMLLLLFVGLQDVIRCYFIQQTQKKQFTALKINNIISEYQTKLVHTLIPPNVLQFVSPGTVMHRRVEDTTDASTRNALRWKHPPSTAMALGALRWKHRIVVEESTPIVVENQQQDSLLTSGEIPVATVMFCSIEFDVSTTESFDVMSNYLDGLDKLVEPSGMFKYQHVSTGKKIDYVVSCPRAACPFDMDQQAAEYPAQNCYEMIKLGWNLLEYTEVFSRSHEMKMKVGINCGPLAGIVLGKYRRFYCLFGNTMNVSARMCANAKQGAICVTPDVAQRLVDYQLRMDDIVITSRGIKDIKGKGPMELFDVSVTCQNVTKKQFQPLRRGASAFQDLVQIFKKQDSTDLQTARRKQKLVDWRDQLRIIEESTQARIYTIRSYSLTFENVEIEAEFLESQVYIHRAGLTGALCLYSLVALWQMYLVTLPDDPAYFESHGQPEIERRMKITTILLYTRVTVMFVTSALLIIWLWRFELMIIVVTNGMKKVLSGRLL
jgi:hypothetical protein